MFRSLARCAAVPSLLAMLAGAPPAHAAILWRHPAPMLVHDNGAGKDILHGAIPPQDASSHRTLYLKFRVDPYSDAALEGTGISTFYEAGVYFFEKGEEHLGIGNAREPIAYSAINVPGRKWNSVDLYSADPELGKDWQCVRKGTPVTILAKIEFVPDHDAHVTVWLNPNLSLGATELNQPANNVTRFDANATFDELRLLHKGTGDGWKFSDLAIASSFEDFIQPRFWQRKSFMGLMMGGLLVSVAGAVRLSERRRARRQIRVLEQERAVAAERARIARDIHDELGSSLTKMSRLAETMEQQSGAQNQVVTLSKIMANTACDTIQTMDEIVWALNPKNDTLKEIANYLVFFTEDYLRPSGMVCSLDVTLNLPHIPVTAEVRHNIVMVVKEALNNAVKHARAQEIRFGLNYTDHTLTVEIADNGQGWGAPTLPVAGNGLTHMRKRMGAIGGRLDILREPGQGTTIKLEVPFPETKGGAQ